VSYEAKFISLPNRWRKLCAAALSLSPFSIPFTDLMAALAFVALAVAS
jgi:hypothetical protein